MPYPVPASNTRLSPAAAAIAAGAAQERDAQGIHWLEAVLAEAKTRIIQQMTPAQIEDPSAADLRDAQAILRPLVETAIGQAAGRGERITQEPAQLVQELLDTIFGFGVLAPYLNDPDVEEIICDGPFDIYVVHAQRGKEKIGARFRDAQEAFHFVNRVSGSRELSVANPKVDSRMRDGSRLHAVMAPLTVNVPIAITIRRHRLVARTLEDLERLGTLTPLVREFLQQAVRARLNIVAAGGTASGKTNFLNALGNAADENDRFVVIEDTPEIQIRQADLVQLCTRAKAEEARAFTMSDLLIEALRMRPDRIIVGEARGPEVVDMLAAANTGHDGLLATIHANSSRDVVQRMETMYLMRGVNVPPLAIRRQIADAFQLIVYLRRVFIAGKPRRYVTEVAEVLPARHMEEEKVAISNIFEDSGQGLHWTGHYPEKLAALMGERGVALPMAFFRRQQ